MYFSPSLMTPKWRVQQRWPLANAFRYADGWYIFTGQTTSIVDRNRVLGGPFAAPQRAWRDAAMKLRTRLRLR